MKLSLPTFEATTPRVATHGKRTVVIHDQCAACREYGILNGAGLCRACWRAAVLAKAGK